MVLPYNNGVNPYTVLDIKPDCSVDEVERQYRQLVALYRSQAGHDPERADRQLRELDAAYRVLSDPEMRGRCDEALAAGMAPAFLAPPGAGPRSSPAYEPPPGRYVRGGMLAVFLFVALAAVVLAYRIGVVGENPFSFSEWSARQLDKQMEPLRQRYRALMTRVDTFEGPSPGYYDPERSFAHLKLDTDVMEMQADRNRGEDQISQVKTGSLDVTPQTVNKSMERLVQDMSKFDADLR
jgi:curved DNA-binding protein CbpA